MAAQKDSKNTSADDDRDPSLAGQDSQDELDDDDEFDDDDSDDDSDEDDDAPADHRAARVAKALGLDEDEQSAADEPGAPKVKNRAERRRDQAARRRGERGRKAASAADDEDDQATPRDRNKRLREQLLKRRREAARDQAKAAQAQGLAPSEMAEDVLVRASASAIKWLGRNKGLVGWLTFGAIAVTAGALYYVYRADTSMAEGSDLLSRAVMADQALLLREEDDTRTDEQKEYDVRKYYPSVAERSKAAQEGYEAVAKAHAGSGAAILANLGRAGALLDGGKHDEAIQAYEAVLDTELAPVDADVKGRALEGIVFAKEAKGDLDGALATAQKLEAVAGFKALGQYHRARLLAANKGAQDEIKSLLVEARKVIEKETVDARAAGGEAANRWLLQEVEERLRAIDPSAVPAKTPSGLGDGPDMERLRQMFESRGLQMPQLPPQAPAPPGGGAK